MPLLYNMSMSVALLASQTPPVILSTGFVDLLAAYNDAGTGGASVIKTFYLREIETVPPKLNKNSCSQELLGRYGGGCNAILYGLALSIGTGLAANCSQGHGLADGGIIQVDSGQSITGLPDGARSHIWLKADNVFAQSTSIGSIPTGAKIYLGSVLTSGGAVVSIDSSNAISLSGGMPLRQTFDPYLPSDSPGAIMLFTITRGGLFFWNGSEHIPVSSAKRSAIAFPSDANYTPTDAACRARTLDLSGVITAGRNLVLPLADGMHHVVRNACAFTVTIISSSGAGVGIGAGKVGVVECDGTNWFRVSADV